MDSLSPEEARERLRAVTVGRYVPRHDLSLAEAKDRLRAADANLDIGPALSALSQGKWREAGLSLALWLATDEGRAFVAPLLLRLLPLANGLLGQLRGHRPRKPAPAEKATGQKATGQKATTNEAQPEA